MSRDLLLCDDLQSPRSPSVQRLHKQISKRQQQYQAQRKQLKQQIQFLNSEIRQLKQKDNDHRKLNESIMISFRNSSHAREDNIMQLQSIREITRKYEEQIAGLRNEHARATRLMEAELKGCREQIDRLRMEGEERVNEVRAELQKKHLSEQEQSRRNHRKQQQSLQNKLRKAENTIRTYRDYIEKMNGPERNEPLRQLSVQYSFFMDDKENRPKKQPARDRNVTIVNALTNQDLGISKVSRADMSRLSRREDTLHERRRSSTIMEAPLQQPITNMASSVTAHPAQPRESRRQRSTKLLSNIEQKTRRSRKFLQYNKQNINQLTTRLSRAISSLECTSRSYQDSKKIEFLKERIDRKLKIF